MVFFPFLIWWIESLILAFAAVGIMVSVYNGRGKYATWITIVLGLISVVSGGAVWQLVANVSFGLITAIIVYFALGILWSFVHWYFYVRQLVDKWNDNFVPESKHHNTFVPPSMKDHVGKIVAWITYWPFDIIPLVLTGPLRRFGSWCVSSLSGIYDGIAKWVTKRFMKFTV